MERFPVEIVDDVEGPKAPFVLQYIRYKIHAPSMVGTIGDLQGLLCPCREPFLHLSAHGQAQCHIDPVHPLVVPRPSLVAQAVKGLPKTLFGMFLGLLPQGPFDLRIVLGHWPVIVHTLAHVEDTARPADTVMGKFIGDGSLPAGL